MVKRIQLLFLAVLTITIMFIYQESRAESYQFEVNGDYYYQKGDFIKEADYELNAAYYFSQVNIDAAPYREAAFMQQAGYIALSGAIGTVEYGEGKLDGEQFGIEIKLVLPEFPLFLKLKYDRREFDGDIEDEGTLYDSDLTYNNYSCGLGYYLMKSLAVAVTYERENEKADYPDIFYKETNKTDSFGGYFKYVTVFENKSGLNLEGSYIYDIYKTDSEGKLKNNTYTLGCDFYITPQIGIGGSAQVNTGDDKEVAGNTYIGRVSVFVIANIAVEAEYGVFKADNTDESEDSKQFTILLKGRI